MKIGVVSYVNAWPLAKFLDAPLIALPPKQLVQKLLAGDVDVALLPTYSILKHQLRMYPQAGVIGCHGFVKSVGFFLRPPLASLRDIQSLYLDNESQSSVYLGKLILKKFYHHDLSKIEFVHADNRHTADAQLLIGDKALFPDITLQNHRYIDLGQIWQERTHTGFMFASWASKRSLMPHEIEQLQQAKNLGLSQLSGMAQSLPADQRSIILDYWQNHIVYEAKPALMDGFKLYKEWLAEAHYYDPKLPHQKEVA